MNNYPASRNWLIVLFLAVQLYCGIGRSFGQANNAVISADAPEVSISRDQGTAILQELRAIHQLLERQAPAGGKPQTASWVVMKPDQNSRALGREDAPVTIVEFSDYQCPFCRRYHGAAYAELKKNYIDTGKVRYVIRDLPLEMHLNASVAANAAYCAGDQDRFWQMRDLLLAESADLSEESIAKFGTQLDLNMERFGACLKAKDHTAQIQRDASVAASLGINSTPSFVIGRTTRGQIEGVRIAGALSYSAFESAIQSQSQIVTTAVK